MKNFQVNQLSPALYSVEGELTFANINKKAVVAFKIDNGTKQITLDLKKVVKSDSAGLALLLEWLKIAQCQQVQLTFNNVPEQLIALANLCGLENVVHIAEQHGTIAMAAK